MCPRWARHVFAVLLSRAGHRDLAAEEDDRGGDHQPEQQHDDRADRAVRRIVSDALDEAIALLNLHRTQLDALANTLIQEETVEEEQIRVIMGVPPVHDEPVVVGATPHEATNGE